MEPIGELYQLYGEWASIDRVISLMYQMQSRESTDGVVARAPQVVGQSDIASTAPALAAGLPEDALYAVSEEEEQALFSQHVMKLSSPPQDKKQQEHSNEFGAERWGTRVAGFPSLTMHNMYVNRPLSQPQYSWLFGAYEQVMTMSGSDAGATKVSESVANVCQPLACSEACHGWIGLWWQD